MNRILASAVLILATCAISRSQQFSSGPEQTSLIELFTSEGCSSCPPADKRMNALADDKGLWVDFIPVAFHVDYWNYLGWPDPYSSVDFSARQRRYAKEWHARTTYTPCFSVNGMATRNPRAKPHADKPGALKVIIKGNEATVTFVPAKPNGEYVAWIAPLSGKLSNPVRAGENRGRTLEHCFVALGLANAKMDSNGQTCSATMTVPADDRTKAIAVWISGSDSLEPLQATGGWLK